MSPFRSSLVRRSLVSSLGLAVAFVSGIARGQYIVIEDSPAGTVSGRVFISSESSESLSLRIDESYSMGPHARVQATRQRLIAELQQLQDEYCRRAMLDEALAVRDQIRRLQADAAIPLPVLSPTATDTTGDAWATPYSMRGQNGKSFYARVTGSTSGSVWGSNIYTDDSDLATAAVHAGVLTVGQSGVVRFTILPGLESYEPTTANGVTTSSWGAFSGSFVIDGVADESFIPSAQRESIGKTAVVYVQGNTQGTVWGSETYTDDSDLGAAAVHAGLLKDGEAGFVVVTLQGPQDAFGSSTQHGVTTHSYGAWTGSFRLSAFQRTNPLPTGVPAIEFDLRLRDEIK